MPRHMHRAHHPRHKTIRVGLSRRGRYKSLLVVLATPGPLGEAYWLEESYAGDMAVKQLINKWGRGHRKAQNCFDLAL